MPNSKMRYLADKVFVHHWPKDSPIWPDSLQQKLDVLINKNSNKKEIIIDSDIIQIQNFKFFSLQKIGISVPFFKEECTMIFESQFEDVFAHVHITMRNDDFIDIFNQLISWKNSINS
ncbi:MAG: hypothetical protein M8317_02915 [Nitrosopumilus sp.]|nr:hypothetical protein [Nitrosopumilus sp.]